MRKYSVLPAASISRAFAGYSTWPARRTHEQ
jgi:hypothetical protein